MGFIKDRNFKSKIPNDLGVSTENLDFNLLMGDIVQAIDITIKQYAQHKNNSIYVRFHANAIEKLGFDEPSEIQEKSIPFIMEGKCFYYEGMNAARR